MPSHIPRLLKLAGPMILSASAITIMQIIDALVLSLHSSVSIAAIGPSGMAVILFQGFLFGTAGYAGTFVAHNHGRGDATGVLTATWLGIYTATGAGLISLLVAWPLAQIFLVLGHDAEVARAERIYFLICMAGSFFPVLNAALAGWLSGIARAVVVTWVTFFSLIINAVLSYGLVLGKWSLPGMGIAGAAIATVISQAVASALYLLLFAKAKGFAKQIARTCNRAELRYFLSMAIPLGLRISGELAAWTFFLVIAGRLGTAELAASGIAFRINGIAFFPALGLGQAAGILAGHARGAGRDDDVPAITWQSLLVCELWMLVMALVFAFYPGQLVALFAGSGAEAAEIIKIGIITMRFVAFYCLFDAANVVISSILAAVGETSWLARTFFICTCVFMVLLWGVDLFMPDLILEWALATAFVFITAVLWFFRFKKGVWRQQQVLRQS